MEGMRVIGPGDIDFHHFPTTDHKTVLAGIKVRVGAGATQDLEQGGHTGGMVRLSVHFPHHPGVRGRVSSLDAEGQVEDFVGPSGLREAWCAWVDERDNGLFLQFGAGGMTGVGARLCAVGAGITEDGEDVLCVHWDGM